MVGGVGLSPEWRAVMNIVAPSDIFVAVVPKHTQPCQNGRDRRVLVQKNRQTNPPIAGIPELPMRGCKQIIFLPFETAQKQQRAATYISFKPRIFLNAPFRGFKQDPRHFQCRIRINLDKLVGMKGRRNVINVEQRRAIMKAHIRALIKHLSKSIIDLNSISYIHHPRQRR